MNELVTGEVDRTRRPAARLALTFAIVATLVAALTALGGKNLGAPPLTRPSELSSWASSLGIAAAALSVVRLVALAAGWYVAVATMLNLLAAAVHLRVLTEAAKFVTLPPIRRILMTIAGIGLTAAAPAVASPTARQSPLAASVSGDVVARPGAVMRRLPTSPGAIVRRLPTPPGAVMHQLENGEDTATLRVLGPGSPDTATLQVVPPAPVTPAPPVMALAWTVEPGDDFWHIATSTLAGQWNRAPSATETVQYWRQVIDSNRSRLADPTNPDLLFPGQVLRLPAPPAPG